ncbi:MAG TPA: class I SAM-dependent methyltransferase [Firmicutes bacterium]|nr:class I SAM-dependent methyltransferase [Bacillota bacterium]
MPSHMSSDDGQNYIGLREWENMAQAWIEEMRYGRNPVRRGFLDRYMLAACGDVTGLRILDCGCGEGRFCRMLVERGAGYVLGVDLCRPLIDAARELKGERDEYCLANVENLDFLAPESFDLAVSYLNQCDVSDFLANNRAVYRVLKKGGRFLVANLHPMRSAAGTWCRNAAGEKLHVILDRYFDEGERHWTMLGCPLINFHRTLSTYIRGFISTGFEIIDVVEPTVGPEDLAAYPELDDERRVPNFIIYILGK